MKPIPISQQLSGPPLLPGPGDEDEQGGEPEIAIPFSGGAQDYQKMLEIIQKTDPGAIWRGQDVSTSRQYPRLWSPKSGYQAPLPISPAGETGTEMFWRQSLELGSLPPKTDPEFSREKAPEIAPGSKDPLDFERAVPGANVPDVPRTLDRPSFKPLQKVPEKLGGPAQTEQVSTSMGRMFPSISSMTAQSSSPQTPDEDPIHQDMDALSKWLATA